MRTLQGRRAAITGAASGIGRATAAELARRGCRLAISDIDEAGLEVTARTCRAAGAEVHTARVDAGSRDALHGWAAEVGALPGGVQVVVNNAGVSLAAPVEDATDEDLAWIMGIDFWGVVHGTRAFLPHLRAAGEGHVVNVSSVFGLVGIPDQAYYCAAKFAVRGFTESLALELAIEGAPIGVTCVHPGGIRTDIARSSRTRGRVDRKLLDRFDRRMLVQPPEKVARAIASAILSRRRRLLVGSDARWIDRVQRLFPSSYQALVRTGFRMMSR